MRSADFVLKVLWAPPYRLTIESLVNGRCRMIQRSTLLFTAGIKFSFPIAGIILWFSFHFVSQLASYSIAQKQMNQILI